MKTRTFPNTIDLCGQPFTLDKSQSDARTLVYTVSSGPAAGAMAVFTSSENIILKDPHEGAHRFQGAAIRYYCSNRTPNLHMAVYCQDGELLQDFKFISVKIVDTVTVTDPKTSREHPINVAFVYQFSRSEGKLLEPEQMEISPESSDMADVISQLDKTAFTGIMGLRKQADTLVVEMIKNFNRIFPKEAIAILSDVKSDTSPDPYRHGRGVL